ncbi:hypothetical protein CO683_14800 [Bradyrhizobium ottawaense]|uniref:hypothetical protein n=1 Tax=Bradyrhizobium ottawaense TaxID=931866 RepID=UPI000BE84A2C|nr:hypothetical protein [Bradyrhizobium ottawaense]PDT69230.1 hypothetical protein CO683_14800 [Bradyrhizobium ottawaense]
MNMLVSTAATAAALPIASPSIAAGSPDDPIFAALDAWRSAEVAVDEMCEIYPRQGTASDMEKLLDQHSLAFRAVMRTRPTTPAGLAALTSWMREEADDMRANSSIWHSKDICAIAATLDDAVRGMSGLKSWSPPANAARAPLAIGIAYEQLLHRYVDESVKWHGADSSSRAYADADEAMCKISEQMEPLEEQIEQIEISHDNQDASAELRTVALKDLRFKLPDVHNEWDISDGNSGDLEMFWQVLEFVGLADFARSIEQRVKIAIERRAAVAVA